MYIRNENGEWEEVYLEPTGDTLPIGSVMPFAGENPTANWLLCKGQAVSRTEYSDLFSVIGTTYGAGDGNTTFNLPNTEDLFPIGASNEYPLGSTGGEKEHTLTIDELPGLTLYNDVGQLNIGGTGGRIAYKTTVSAHNNIPPYLALNYIIKAKDSVGLVGNVVDTMESNNDKDVPNVKTIKEYVNDKYSTEEQVVGTWIDGKTIYRKVFTGTFSDSATLISNVDTLVNSYGTAVVNGAGYNKRTLGYYEYYGNLSYLFKVQHNSNNAIVVMINKEGTATTATGHIVLEYTKTTD